jgi:3-hydroxy-9,10-secoandrosta-1,3,5(10)-triene-9,17-dione monooxygenase
MTRPEPELTFDQMLLRAAAMRRCLRERQQQCEELGRIPEETHRDFANAGFYRVLRPRCFGGYEFSTSSFVRLIMEIARGCIDSAWVLSLFASEPAAFLPLFPDAARREAYGAEGDCLAARVVLPGGTAVPDRDGFRVHGTWDYCSGCDIATHFLGTVLLRDSEARAPAGIACVLFGREQYDIVDNWDMMGMQGTGSRRVVVRECTVPAHRMLTLSGGLWESERGSPLAVGGFAACAVGAGAARGALDLYEEILRNRKWIVPPFQARFELPELQQSFGSAQALVDTAEAALVSLADRYSELCRMSLAERTRVPAREVRRIHRAGLQCLELAWQAVDLMFRTGGSSSAASQAPLGHYFRGLAVIRTHIGMQHDHVSGNVARLHFGLPPLSPL